MTEITDRIQEYRDHELAWDALVKYLTGRAYPPPDRYRAHDPQTVTTILEREGVDRYHDTGTWDEVIHARNRGLLTNDEYMKILEADQHRPKTTELGESGGHPFRGNQHTGGIGGVDTPSAKDEAERLKTAGVSPDIADRLGQHLYDLNKEYGTDVRFSPDPVDTGWLVADPPFFTTDNNGMVKANPMINDDSARSQYDEGWLATPTLEGMVDHEFAHGVIERRGAGSVGRDAYMAGNRAAMDAGVMNDQSVVTPALSEYAAVGGPAEFLPEAFAAYKEGVARTTWVKDVGGAMDKVMRNG